MPPKADKMYSADFVAAVSAATSATSLSMKHYELMSSMDGVKTASAFQHDFRAILAELKELKALVDSGETFKPVAPSTKRGTYCRCPSSPSPHFHFCPANTAHSHSLPAPRQQ